MKIKKIMHILIMAMVIMAGNTNAKTQPQELWTLKKIKNFIQSSGFSKLFPALKIGNNMLISKLEDTMTFITVSDDFIIIASSLPCDFSLNEINNLNRNASLSGGYLVKIDNIIYLRDQIAHPNLITVSRDEMARFLLGHTKQRDYPPCER